VRIEAQNLSLQSSARLQGKEGLSWAGRELSPQVFGVVTALKMDSSDGVVQS